MKADIDQRIQDHPSTGSAQIWTHRSLFSSGTPRLNAKSRGSTSATSDATRTLAVCTRLLDDRDDMVVKAMSWALRELAKRNSRAVRTFLSEHCERLTRRVRREVTNKLATGRKSPRPRT
jgi:hypothetical protein